MLFRGGQNTPQADHEQIVDQMRVDIFGSSAHLTLFKVTESFTNRGLDFSLESSSAPRLRPERRDGFTHGRSVASHNKSRAIVAGVIHNIFYRIAN